MYGSGLSPSRARHKFTTQTQQQPEKGKGALFRVPILPEVLVVLTELVVQLFTGCPADGERKRGFLTQMEALETVSQVGEQGGCPRGGKWRPLSWFLGAFQPLQCCLPTPHPWPSESHPAPGAATVGAALLQQFDKEDEATADSCKRLEQVFPMAGDMVSTRAPALPPSWPLQLQEPSRALNHQTAGTTPGGPAELTCLA